MKVIILCGGKGRTLWPISRDNIPKQFSRLIFDKSLFERTLEIWSELSPAEDILAVAPQDNKFFIKSQSIEVFKTKHIKHLQEPYARGTLKAVAYAILNLIQNEVSNSEIIVISNSDQIWRIDKENFSKMFNNTINKLPPDKIIAIASSKAKFLKDKILTEKVNNSSLQKFLSFSKTSNLSNIGLYISYLSVFRDIIQRAYSKSIESIIEDETLDGVRFEDAISRVPENILVDDWKVDVIDIDNLDDISLLLDKDKNGNYIKGDVAIHKSKNTTVISTKRLVVAEGVKDLDIIETPDVVYVSSKKSDKSILSVIRDREEAKVGVTDYRPWGSFTVLDKGPNYQIKKITVNPGESLSLQLHYHRSEHWVVVKGTAKVTINDNVIYVRENESTFIPKTAKHRLENPGKIPLEIIEIQIGEYLSEDDIVRFQDVYGR